MSNVVDVIVASISGDRGGARCDSRFAQVVPSVATSVAGIHRAPSGRMPAAAAMIGVHGHPGDLGGLVVVDVQREESGDGGGVSAVSGSMTGIARSYHAIVVCDATTW
jgi:hypothetical protein